jgi:hypothetical protein
MAEREKAHIPQMDRFPAQSKLRSRAGSQIKAIAVLDKEIERLRQREGEIGSIDGDSRAQTLFGGS